MKRFGGQQSLFSRVNARKIPDVLYKQLVSLITKGEIKPGEKLPSERDMALELGVSRQSVREALYRAKASGLIEVKHGGGSFVISSLKGTLKQPLSVLLEGQGEKIFEFLEVRKLIELWCAEKASLSARPADLHRMEGTLKRMHKAKLATTGWEKADLEFHSAIAAATHNVIALHLMEGLKDSFHAYFSFKKFTTRPEKRDIILKQHERIFEAIKGKRPREARKRAQEHLAYVEKLITDNFGGKTRM